MRHHPDGTLPVLPTTCGCAIDPAMGVQAQRAVWKEKRAVAVLPYMLEKSPPGGHTSTAEFAAS